MAEWDTRAVQAHIVRDARVPKGGAYRTIANLLPLLDRHMRAVVTPRLLEVNEDWLTSSASFPVLQGQALYRIPWRSLRLLDVSLLDAQGRPRRDFARATDTQVKRLRTQGWTREPGTPSMWDVEASSIRLYPTPDASAVYTLALRFARRPGRLVDSQGPEAWRVEDVNVATGVVLVQGADTPSVDTDFDFIQGSPSFSALQDDCFAIDVTSAGPDLWYVTFDGLDVSTISLGDYMAIVGTSPVPQLPLDYIPVLEQSVVEQILRNNGDMEGAKSAKDDIGVLMLSAQANIEPRSTEPEVCVPYDY